MGKVFDAYTLRARYYPALLAILPLLIALAILISWSKFGLSNLLATLALPVMTYAAADTARRLGKRVEEIMFAGPTGKPSVTMLRYSDPTFDRETKKRYHAFIASKIGSKPPTEQTERKDPRGADAFYERCGAWIRENTRSSKKFAILFAENVTYGFRRNLLGLKPFALGLNLALIIGSGALLYYDGVWAEFDDQSRRLVIVIVFAIVHSAFMLFAVNTRSVAEASRTYARQLILSIEALSEIPKPKRVVGAKS